MAAVAAGPARGLLGFEIRSELDLRYLRPGSGTLLRVVEEDAPPPSGGQLLIEWRSRPDNPFRGRLYRQGATFAFWTSDAGWFAIDPSVPLITVQAPFPPGLGEPRLWGVPAMLCILARGRLPIHAAAVEVGGRALLFAAPGGHGKTTLAGAFLRTGHRVLAEDMSCLGLEGHPHLFPGPAVLRVRPDTYARLSLPGTFPVWAGPGRVHLAIEDGLRGDSSPVPLGGVVFLRPAEGRPRLERLAVQEALPDLWALTFRLPSEEDRTRCFEGLTSLGDRVPMWNLYRDLSYRELPRAIEEVVSACLAA